jgi:hypothetical protein
MTIEEAKKLASLISQIDEGNHNLMKYACSDANTFFSPWHFEVVDGSAKWTHQVKLSNANLSSWVITSEEIKREIDDKEQSNPVPEQKI